MLLPIEAAFNINNNNKPYYSTTNEMYYTTILYYSIIVYRLVPVEGPGDAIPCLLVIITITNS